MAVKGTEIERLIVRLVGDNKMYVQSLKEAARLTETFTQDAIGRWRDAKGKFVSSQTAMAAEASRTLLKLNEYGTRLSHVGRIMQNVGRDARQLGMAMGLRLTAPIVGLGIAGAKTFSDYEQKLSEITGLVGVSADEMKRFDAAIREMAPAVGQGPVELADALYFITGAGVKGQLALETLEASAKAASAGLGSTAVVADAVTSAVNAYGAATLPASRATDILVAAIREGKTEADALAPVLGRLLPTASAMGVSFEEIAGVMAVMSRTGLDAAEASTSVGAVLSTMLKPGKEASKILHAAGLSMKQLRDIAGQPGGLVEVMRILERTFAGNDEALAMIVPNVRAFRGIMNVLAQDTEIVDGIMKGVADSVGDTDAAFKAGADTVNRQWNQAIADMKVALIELGETMRPIIDEVTQMGKGVSKWFQGLSDESKETVVQLLAITAAIGPVLVLVGALIGALGKLVSAIGFVLKSAYLLRIALMSLRLGIPGLIAALTILVMYLINKFHPATRKLAADLKMLQGVTDEYVEVINNRFNKSLEGIGELPIDEQAEALEQMKRNIAGSLEASKRDIEDFKNEIKMLEAGEGNGGFGLNSVNALMDSHGIELAKGHLEDARARAEAFKSQLERINETIKAIGNQTEGGEAALDAIVPRPEEIETFAKALERQLKDLEIEFGGKGAGVSDGMIQRLQEFSRLQDELEATGNVLDDSELERLNILNKQIMAIEEQITAQEKLSKEAEKVAKEQEQARKDMASRAADLLKETLTPLQDLRTQLEEVWKLMESGALTDAEGNAIADGLMAKFAEGAAVDKVTAGSAIKFGSAEGELLRSQQADQSIEKGVWELVERTEVQIRTEGEILKTLQNGPGVNLVPVRGF